MFQLVRQALLKKMFDCSQQEFNQGHLINTFNALLIIYRRHVIIPIMYRRHVIDSWTIKLSVRDKHPSHHLYQYLNTDVMPCPMTKM